MRKMSFKSEFTPHQEKKLVEMVERHPCIYDISSQLYKDHHLKENGWKEIAKRVGRSAEQCKWRWRNIKDTYVKRKRKGKLGTEPSSSIQKKWHLATMLKFMDDIQFKKRSNITSTTNLDQPMDFLDILNSADLIHNEAQSSKEQSTQSTLTTFKTTSKVITTSADSGSNRRHFKKSNKTYKTPESNEERIMEVKINKPEKPLDKIELGEMLSNQEDHVDVFFRSVALSVKGFPRHLISQAKLRTLQMLVELESMCLSNNHNFSAVASTCSALTDTYDDSSSA